jgi:hypothetical protein
MRSVWSFWSSPFRGGRSAWRSELHHCLAWILSVESARKHYPHTTLITDDDGAHLLVSTLGLEFEHVSTRLNTLKYHEPFWWAFGKLVAYSVQEEPFVHIDSDVILWERLPHRLEDADVFAQNPEVYDWRDMVYRPEMVEHALRRVNGWIPEELDAYIPIGGVHRAVCCGILGGCRVDFLRHYAGQAIKMMESPRNQPAWPGIEGKTWLSVVFEQYLLAACLDYHQRRNDSPYHDVSIEYLFDSVETAYSRADAVGYTHLYGAKQNPKILEKLERRVQSDYPALYERCLRYCRTRA